MIILQEINQTFIFDLKKKKQLKKMIYILLLIIISGGTKKELLTPLFPVQYANY